jgi:hypothetical protein
MVGNSCGDAAHSVAVAIIICWCTTQARSCFWYPGNLGMYQVPDDQPSAGKFGGKLYLEQVPDP